MNQAKLKSKRAISLVLSVLIALAPCLPVMTALAADSRWVITNEDPDAELRIWKNSQYVVDNNKHITNYSITTLAVDPVFTSDASDGASALYVTNGSTVEFDNAIITGNGTMSDHDLAEEYASKYGYAAAVLVNNGSKLTLNNPTINSTADSYANGAFSSDEDSELYIYGGEITTGNTLGHGIDATYGGYIYAEDLVITTTGNNSGAIATDFAGGIIDALRVSATTAARGSPAIYAAGNSIITVTDSTLTSTGGEAVMIAHDGGYTYLYDCDVTGLIGLNCHNSMVPIPSYLVMEGGTLTSTADALITCDGGNGDFSLNGVECSIADGYNFIGSSAMRGTMAVNLANMDVTGDVDSVGAALTVNLENTALEGAIKAYAISIDGASVWYITGYSSLSELTVESASSIKAPSGYRPVMTVDGEEVSIEAGTYAGDIVLDIEETNPEEYTGTEPVSAIQTYPYGLIISDGDLPAAASGYQLTMTVDGVETRIAAGTYNGVVVLTPTADYIIAGRGPGGNVTEYFRMAAYIDNGVIDATRYVESAIISGTVTGTEATDIVINSQNDKFNGLMIMSGSYSILRPVITLNGNGGDDFNGFGAGIMTTGTANVSIDGAKIDTTGAIRTAIWAGGSSVISVKNSVITAYSADETDQAFIDLTVPMMKQVPWALGLVGNIRATNVLGRAQATYTDSIVVSESWGALSTDSGSSGVKALTTNNVLSGIGSLELARDGKDYDATKTVDGVEYGFNMGGSGYVSYADQGVINTYNDSEFYAPDYVLIVAAGSSSAVFNGGVNVSNRVGVMWHQTRGGSVQINSGSWSVAQTMFLLKSSTSNAAYTGLVVDGAELEIRNDNGVLYQLMESDDAGGIVVREYTIPVIEDDWSAVTAATASDTSATATFKNLSVTGDIFNSRYTKKQGLEVTFDNAGITGVISSSNANHVDANGNVIPGGTRIAQADDEYAYLYAGRIINSPSAAVNNPVSLTLTNGSEWEITGKSYLSALTIDSSSAINAAAGYVVVMTVDGEAVDIEAGAYTGDIVLSPEIDTRPAVYTGPNPVAETQLYPYGLTIDSVIPAAASGYLLTMTVNGVETKIAAGAYIGEVILTPTVSISTSSLTASTRSSYAETYRAAVTVDLNGYSGSKSVGETNTGLLAGGTYDADTGVFSGYDIKSGTGDYVGAPQFSAFIFNAAGSGTKMEYTVRDSSIELISDSDGTASTINDFTGLGAAIIAAGPIKLTLDNVFVHTAGVAKSALITSGKGTAGALNAADVLIKKSTLISDGGTVYDGYINTANTSTMVTPPWCLGFQGNSRTTNMLGTYATNTYVDSTVETAGWAALSTDGCTAVKHTVINSTLRFTDRKNGGYGVYAIGSNTVIDFFGSNLDTATFGAVVREGAVNFLSYTGGDEKTISKLDAARTTAFENVKSDEVEDGVVVPTIVNSQMGVMFHASGNNTVNVLEGTEFHTKNAAFVIRNLTNITVNVDSAVIDVEDGVILQQMDDEDGTMITGGPQTFKSPVTEAAGWPAFKTTGTSGTGATANFSNVDLVGDMYNSTGLLATGKSLTINLGANATLEGVITSSTAAHVWMEWSDETERFEYMTDPSNVPSGTAYSYAEIEANGQTYLQATGFTISQHYNISHVVNQPAVSSQNPVRVNLTGNAVWTVTDLCYLASLSIGADAAVTAPTGYELVMTVNGTETPIEAGKSYSGAIVLSVEAAKTMFYLSVPDTSVETDPIAYLLEMENAENVASILIKFEVDGAKLAGAGFNAMNGFAALDAELIWVEKDNGIWGSSLLLVPNDVSTGFTALEKIALLELLFSAKDLGDATLTITSISVYVFGETAADDHYIDVYLANATATTSIVKYYSKYDLNKTGAVDQSDLAIVQRYYLANEGDDNWDAARIADVNGDGVVNIKDLIEIYRNFTR